MIIENISTKSMMPENRGKNIISFDDEEVESLADHNYPVASLTKQELDQVTALEQKLNSGSGEQKILIAYTKA